MTTTRIKLLASIVRTITDRRAWNGFECYTITFGKTLKDSVKIECPNGDSCLFGLHKDDPFLSCGISEDEAGEVMRQIAEKYGAKYREELN